MSVELALLAILGAATFFAVALAFVFVFRQFAFAMAARSEGLIVIATSLHNRRSVVGIDCSDGSSDFAGWEERLEGARLVRLDSADRSIIDADEVWRLVHEGQFTWAGWGRVRPPLGRLRFEAFLRANGGPERVGQEMRDHKSREFALGVAAIVIGAIIVGALWWMGLIGQPTSFP